MDSLGKGIIIFLKEKYMIKIGTLFKVYFLHGTLYYLEQLRPITQEDFNILYISPAISFITEDDWKYEIVDYMKKGTVEYKAGYHIQFKYKDELIDALAQELHSGDFQFDVQDSISNLFKHYETFLRIPFDYRGCKDTTSKKKKEANVLKKLKKMVSDNANKSIEELYKEAIKDTETRINNINFTYTNELKRNIKQNTSFHTSITEKYSDEIIKVVEDIETKRLEIKKLTTEIRNLGEKVNQEHREKCQEEISNWKEVPLEVQEQLTKELENFKLRILETDFGNFYIERKKIPL